MRNAAIVLLFGPILLTAADRHLTSAQLFSVYTGVISDQRLSKSDFEAIKPELQKDGFSTSDGISWRMSDASGTVFILALPDGGKFSVRYKPPTPARFVKTAHTDRRCIAVGPGAGGRRSW